jgi:hypothetical protein
MKLLWYPNFPDEGMKAKKRTTLHSFMDAHGGGKDAISPSPASRDMSLAALPQSNLPAPCRIPGPGSSRQREEKVASMRCGVSSLRIAVARRHIARNGSFEYNDRVMNAVSQ